MEINICNDINEDVKNKIIDIIKDSFEQKEHTKSGYARHKLKELYPNEKWNVFYVFQKGNNNYFSSASGRIFICKYKDYRIIITPSENTLKEAKNAPKDEKNIEKLTEDIKSLNKRISDSKLKFNEYENVIKKYKTMIEELNFKLESSQKVIFGKEKEIENLKLQIQNDNRNNSSNTIFYSRDQMLALNFISSDQKLHFAIPCLMKDTFVDVERKLYEQFPEYKETNNNFLVNAKMILRFKTVEENKFQIGIPIIILTNQNK